jgi:homocysteine S-methyltransferase
MTVRTHLPQLTSDQPFLSDGGLETTIVFEHGVDLPEFAAFPLLEHDAGRATLAAYYEPFLDVADRHRAGFVLDTPTWRANLDWAARLGYDAITLTSINHRSVEFVRGLVEGRTNATVVNGIIGPRGDGYVVDSSMTAAEAAAYHGLQARAFAEAGADMITATTMTYVEEAIGIVRAAVAVGLPVAVSFTVETDGRLPSGQPLGDAIAEVDRVTDGAAAYFMVNCAHPTHFVDVLDPTSDWIDRIRGVRANASPASHAELDAATELDRGDIDDLAALYGELRSRIDLRVIGGCCGTDHEHVAHLATALLDTAAAR